MQGRLCYLRAYALMQLPKEREALRRGPTRKGIYMLPDTLIVLSEPRRVVNRPELCGALIIPRGAVTGIEVVEVRDEGSVHYNVAVRVRKTTGEIVDHPIAGYISATRDNALRTLLEQWHAPSPD